MMSGDAVFVVNSGSSSLKFGVFAERADEVHALYRGAVEGIGADQGKIWLRGGTGETLIEKTKAFPAQKDAARAVAAELSEMALPDLGAVGHRVVHGGPSLTEHQKITPQVLEKLEAAEHFAPLHVPVALELIRETQQLFPGVAQFACFDRRFTGRCLRLRRGCRCRRNSGTQGFADTDFMDCRANRFSMRWGRIGRRG